MPPFRLGSITPFTAMTCLEWLGSALMRVGSRRIPFPYRYDEDGELRLIVNKTNFDGIAASALNQIRQYGASSVGVIILMLDVIARVAVQLPRARSIAPPSSATQRRLATMRWRWR